MGADRGRTTEVQKKKEPILLLHCTHQQKAPPLQVPPIKHTLKIQPLRGTQDTALCHPWHCCCREWRFTLDLFWLNLTLSKVLLTLPARENSAATFVRDHTGTTPLHHWEEQEPPLGLSCYFRTHCHEHPHLHFVSKEAILSS